MVSRYLAMVLTMAEHTGRPDLRAKALGRLVDELGTTRRSAPRSVYLHDGSRILAADDAAVAMLGRDIVGRPALSVVNEARHAEVTARIGATRAGVAASPWVGPLVGAHGGVVHASVTAIPALHLGLPCVRVTVADLAGLARLD